MKTEEKLIPIELFICRRCGTQIRIPYRFQEPIRKEDKRKIFLYEIDKIVRCCRKPDLIWKSTLRDNELKKSARIRELRELRPKELEKIAIYLL